MQSEPFIKSLNYKYKPSVDEKNMFKLSLAIFLLNVFRAFDTGYGAPIHQGGSYGGFGPAPYGGGVRVETIGGPGYGLNWNPWQINNMYDLMH